MSRRAGIGLLMAVLVIVAAGDLVRLARDSSREPAESRLKAAFPEATGFTKIGGDLPGWSATKDGREVGFIVRDHARWMGAVREALERARGAAGESR